MNRLIGQEKEVTTTKGTPSVRRDPAKPQVTTCSTTPPGPTPPPIRTTGPTGLNVTPKPKTTAKPAGQQAGQKVQVKR